jgi:hypothetical protein
VRPRSLYDAPGAPAAPAAPSAAEPARHLSRAEAEALAKRVLGFATAGETRVTVQSGARQGTRFAVNQITTAGDRYDVTVTVRSAVGQARRDRGDQRARRRVAEARGGPARRAAGGGFAPRTRRALPELGSQQ